MRKFVIAACLAVAAGTASAGLILSELSAPPTFWIDLAIAISGMEPIGPIRAM